MCTIRGGLVHEGAPVVPGEVGTFIAGRPSTAAKMKAARKWLLEADAVDFERLSERGIIDASGVSHELLLSDPLLNDDSRGHAKALFFRHGGERRPKQP